MTELSMNELRMLALVQENHMSNVELAQRLGMAPSPCLRRMKSLRDQGFIERTVSVLNRRLLGFEILALTQIKVPQINMRSMDEEFRRAIQREPAIIGCYTISGHFDFLLKVVAISIDAYAHFARNVIVRLPGVADMSSSFVLETVKDSTALPLEILKRQAAKR